MKIATSKCKMGRIKFLSLPTSLLLPLPYDCSLILKYYELCDEIICNMCSCLMTFCQNNFWVNAKISKWRISSIFVSLISFQSSDKIKIKKKWIFWVVVTIIFRNRYGGRTEFINMSGWNKNHESSKKPNF